jgi:predicted AlkP superfamily phosphohydrolase/phosphomutase
MIELRRKLEALTDPKTGKHPISNIYFADEIYQKELLGDAPDMIVGYNRGFRASWETAIGKTPREWFSDNTEKWGGDHCIDAKLVPGIIFSNKKIESNSPALTDLAPTILSEFGLKKGRGMAGKNIF